MNNVFPFSTIATGKRFVRRDSEIRTFISLIERGRNVVLAEPLKTGKSSLVRQGFQEMEQSGRPFIPVPVALQDARTASSLMLRLTEAVQQTTEGGLPEAAAADGLREAFLLPFRAGKRTGVRRVVVFEEFQSLLLGDDADNICRTLAEVFETLPDELAGGAVYVLVGSRVNAMLDMMEHTRLGRHLQRLRLSTPDLKDTVEHVVRGFLASGKVVEQDPAREICRTLRGNLWYINHLSAICESLTRGYITNAMLQDSLAALTAIHEPLFVTLTSDLTGFQLSLLRAILDGHTHFSSAEIIRRYNLHSSANVRRVKDALCKKEIISFDGEDGAPILQDPLFEYWLRNVYFHPDNL